jgi:type VI protein secretion system component VasK
MNKYFKRALILDMACIAVALVVLYLANNGIISFPWLVTGAIIALLLLIWSLVTLMKARRLNRELIAAYEAEMAKAKQDEEAEDADQAEENEETEQDEKAEKEQA